MDHTQTQVLGPPPKTGRNGESGAVKVYDQLIVPRVKAVGVVQPAPVETAPPPQSLKAQPNVERESTSADVAVKSPQRLGRRWVLATVVIAAVAVGGWYAHRYQTAGREIEAHQDESNNRRAALGFAHAGTGAGVTDSPTVRVETISVEVVQRPRVIHLTGTLNADEQSSVASNVNGIVCEVRVDRGSVVKKGEVLVQLDPTDAKNKLAEGMALVVELKSKLSWDNESAGFVAEEQPEVKLAKASLMLATSQKARAELLLSRQASSAEECERYQAEYECAVQRHRQSRQQARQNFHSYETAVAKLDALRKAVADATIVAPFDGMISEKNVALGEQVTGGLGASKIVTMVQTNPLRLSLTLPQQNIGQIEAGQKVRFHVDSYPDTTFEAKVRYISPGVTSDTRALIVEAVVDNSSARLRPGLFATAELEVSQKQTEMLVPATAVQRTGEVARVFVLRDGVARQQVIALGEEANGKVHITSGLTGKEVLLARPELFHDEDKVRG